MFSSTFRDPFFRSALEDWATVDPFAGTELLPLTAATTGGRGRARGGLGRLLTVDSYEDQNEFHVYCEASCHESSKCPGVAKDKLDINVDNKILHIKCNKQSPDYSNVQNMSRNEINYGTDTRSIRIPANYSDDCSCCCYKDGVLHISFPKIAEREGKKLLIQSS